MSVVESSGCPNMMNSTVEAVVGVQTTGHLNLPRVHTNSWAVSMEVQGGP